MELLEELKELVEEGWVITHISTKPEYMSKRGREDPPNKFVITPDRFFTGVTDVEVRLVNPVNLDERFVVDDNKLIMGRLNKSQLNEFLEYISLSQGY